MLRFALLQHSLGVFVLSDGRFNPACERSNCDDCLLQGLRLCDLRGPRPVHLIDSDKLLGQQRLNSMQIVIRIGPLRPCPGDTLFRVRHVSPRLIDRRRPSGYVRFRCSGYWPAQPKPRSPGPRFFAARLRSGLQERPARIGLFPGVPIRPVIDLEQQIALLHELVVPHTETE